MKQEQDAMKRDFLTSKNMIAEVKKKSLNRIER